MRDPLIDKPLSAPPQWITGPVPLDAVPPSPGPSEPPDPVAPLAEQPDAHGDGGIEGDVADRAARLGLALVGILSLAAALASVVAIHFGWLGLSW